MIILYCILFFVILLKTIWNKAKSVLFIYFFVLEWRRGTIYVSTHYGAEEPKVWMDEENVLSLFSHEKDALFLQNFSNKKNVSLCFFIEFNAIIIQFRSCQISLFSLCFLKFWKSLLLTEIFAQILKWNNLFVDTGALGICWWMCSIRFSSSQLRRFNFI